MRVSTRASRAALALVVLAVVLTGTSMAVAALTPGRESQPRYTVVASAEEIAAGADGPIVAAPVSWFQGASEKITLVAVGGLLLGLAAAVRRTT